MKTRVIVAIAACAISSAPVLAADALAQDEPPICTDRPTKANAVCSVAAGAIQLEMDAYNYARTTVGDTRSTTALYSNPTLKLGLTDRSDLEVNWAPHVVAKTETPLGNTRQSGVGDVYVRYKHRITGDDASVGVALIPFVKIPAAPLGIGNDEFEGGLAAPVQIGLSQGFTLTFGPELDVLSEADGTGERLNVVNLVNLSRSFGKLTLYGEVWTANDVMAEGSFDQASVDFAAAYLVAPRLQIDAGINLGLNRNTPDAQVYVGLSTRF